MNICIDFSDKDSIAAGLREIATAVEALEVKDDEALDLDMLAQSLRDAKAEAESLSAAIADLQDSSIGSISSDIDSVEGDAQSLVSTLDNLLQDVESAQQ